MDFMLYTMAIGQLRMYFGFGDDTAGMLGTVTLVMSGVGGTIFGYVADRFGRTRALMGTILLFSAGVAWRRDVAERHATAVLAGSARHRHGRRVGLRRGARQRDLARRASQQGHQHHAVRMGPRLHDGVHLGRDHPGLAVAWRRRLAMAVRGGRRAGALHAVDSTLRAGAGGVEPPGRGRRAGQVRLPPFSGRRCSGARCSSSRSAPRCSLRIGASSSGCRRFWPGRSRRAAPAWASSDRCHGSSRCSWARTSAT